MITCPNNCDTSRLDAILFADEASDEYRTASAHVESCPECQRRLTELAGDEEEWRHVADLLKKDPLADEEFLSSINEAEAHRRPREAHQLVDLLDPPSHPEMLGRLGRYDIERVIGAGGMGVVLRGFDTDLNRPVAIKVLARHLAHSGAARQRFARESRAAAAVVHEHVVAIHNVETSGETPFLVMQYVAGESLQARVDREGPLDTREILRIGIQAAAGLQAAHDQGVIHRDIKPANILLEHGVDRALVTDFGLARTVDDATLTHTGVIAGTPHYMSPEQADGRQTDLRTDLFSLGSVLYFMATGRPPFRAERAMGVLHRICHDRQRPAWEINPELPDELSDLIDELLQKNPNRRIAAAADVQRRLTDLLAHMQHRTVRRRHRWVRLAQRHRGGIGAAVGASVLTLTALWFTVGDGSSFAIRWFPVDAAPTPQLKQDKVDDHSPGDLAIEKTFSVETWHLASEREAEQFTQSLQETDVALQRLETRAAISDHAPTTEASWQADLDQLNQHLEQLEQEPFP